MAAGGLKWQNYIELIRKRESFERVTELNFQGLDPSGSPEDPHTQANPHIQEEPSSGAGGAAQTQAQAQTQTRPSQRAPIAAAGLKWQSYIRSLLGNVTGLKG